MVAHAATCYRSSASGGPAGPTNLTGALCAKAVALAVNIYLVLSVAGDFTAAAIGLRDIGAVGGLVSLVVSVWVAGRLLGIRGVHNHVVVGAGTLLIFWIVAFLLVMFLADMGG